MRVRTQLIISDDLLAKIDEIAGEKQKRSLVVETALREFIVREEKKRPKVVAVDEHAAPGAHGRPVTKPAAMPVAKPAAKPAGAKSVAAKPAAAKALTRGKR